MLIEKTVRKIFDKINPEELSYYVAHSRSEVTVVKRLSYLIQQELGKQLIVRNEYTDKKLGIEKADLVIFEKKNVHNVKCYAEVKWLFSHHLFDEENWKYREKPHNHHWPLKKDFQKLLSAKIERGERLFLLLITHYNTIEIPEYWTDKSYHIKVFRDHSLENENVELMLRGRINQVITSTEGLNISSNAFQPDLRLNIGLKSFNSVENVPTSLLYAVINLNAIYHRSPVGH